jgi:hypothetical protein
MTDISDTKRINTRFYYTFIMSTISEIISMVEGKKTIGISSETYRELVEVGGYDETMDQIVRKCVEAYNREQTRKQAKK